MSQQYTQPDTERPRILCRLENGSIEIAHAASKDNGKDPESYGKLKFIGVGTYHMINGIKQAGISKSRFYREG